MALEVAGPSRASGPSLQASFVLFINTTQRNVNLYWIDYQGRQTFYMTLAPQANAKVNTYRLHPWIFRDNRSGERMQVAHQNTYWPQPYLMRDPRILNQWIPCRKQVLIHFPLRTLRETCLWSVVATLAEEDSQPDESNNDGSVATENIDRLCIPRTLKTDLKFLLHALEGRLGRAA